jgi:hypothetical protein
MSNVQVVLSELLIEYGMKCASIYSIFSVLVEYDYLPVSRKMSILKIILTFNP